MAKKKQKKVGMLKRKVQKNIKKTKQRKLTASRVPAQNSQKQIVQLLHKVPYLTYEPELQDFGFDQEKIQQYKQEGLTDPYIILELANEEWIQSLFTLLGKIQDRLENGSKKSLMIQGLVHFFQQGIPIFINPIIISIYLQTLAKMQDQIITPDDLQRKIKEYEQANQHDIETLSTPDQNIDANTQKDVIDEYENDIEDAKPLMVPSQIMQAFQKKVSDDIADDVDVFVEDYAEKPLAEWDSKMVENFKEWFKNNMNPLEEDIDVMQNALRIFFEYLKENKHLSENQIKTILPLFQ